jgi:hypothetical protein
MDRFFPATVMAGRLFLPASSSPDGRPTLQPERAVDMLLEVYAVVGHRKVRTEEELETAIHGSVGREGSNTVWIAEGMEDEVRRRVEMPFARGGW